MSNRPWNRHPVGYRMCAPRARDGRLLTVSPTLAYATRRYARTDQAPSARRSVACHVTSDGARLRFDNTKRHRKKDGRLSDAPSARSTASNPRNEPLIQWGNDCNARTSSEPSPTYSTPCGPHRTRRAPAAPGPGVGVTKVRYAINHISRPFHLRVRDNNNLRNSYIEITGRASAR